MPASCFWPGSCWEGDNRVGAILGLLGGGGSGSYGNSNQAGPANAGGVTVNAGSGSNVVTYVLIGVLGFLGLMALLLFMRRK